MLSPSSLETSASAWKSPGLQASGYHHALCVPYACVAPPQCLMHVLNMLRSEICELSGHIAQNHVYNIHKRAVGLPLQ